MHMILPAISLFKAFSAVAEPPANSGGTGGIVDIGANGIHIGGVMSGSGFITKTGSGTLTLSGSNSYSGGITISDGTLVTGSSTLTSETTHSGVSFLYLELAGQRDSFLTTDSVYSGSITSSGREITLNVEMRQVYPTESQVVFTAIPETAYFGAILAACSFIFLLCRLCSK